MLIPLAVALYNKSDIANTFSKIKNGTYEGQALDIMAKSLSTAQKKFPIDWGISEGQAMSVLGNYADLVRAGKIKSWWKSTVQEKAALAKTLGESVFKNDTDYAKKALWVLQSLGNIKISDGEIYEYFTGVIPRSTIESNARISELVETGAKYASIPLKSASKGIQEATKDNPWYLRPGFIAGSLVFVGGVYAYNVFIRPLLTAKKKVFKNPTAQSIYETFNAKPVSLSYPVLMNSEIDSPDDLAELGKVEAIQYSSDKWDGVERSYRHDFDDPPALLCDSDNDLILMGNYKITRKGIEG